MASPGKRLSVALSEEVDKSAKRPKHNPSEGKASPATKRPSLSAPSIQVIDLTGDDDYNDLGPRLATGGRVQGMEPKSPEDVGKRVEPKPATPSRSPAQTNLTVDKIEQQSPATLLGKWRGLHPYSTSYGLPTGDGYDRLRPLSSAARDAAGETRPWPKTNEQAQKYPPRVPTAYQEPVFEDTTISNSSNRHYDFQPEGECDDTNRIAYDELQNGRESAYDTCFGLVCIVHLLSSKLS